MKKPTRREFVSTAAKATSLAALASVFPPSARAQACPKETLLKIGEISSKGGGVLKGVMKIRNTRKKLPGYTGSQPPMMRYFEGYSQLDEQPNVWPPKELLDRLLPGPTLRVGVGERVEITFLNQTDVSQFPGLTFDSAETGATDGCDQATNATLPTPPGPDKNWYPGTRGDSFPNCFHASSSANLHFHGTHITPDAFGDNVLVQVRPDPKLTESSVKETLEKVFAQCREHAGHVPVWGDVAPEYVKMQEAAVKNYDLTAIWKGKRGDGTTSALPEPNQLTPANKKLTDKGLWPQYFVGAYPNCFTLTRAAGHEMGQSPGTHWYHAHKHGSTSINLFNGLSGVLIIEGDYDRDLEKIYPNLKATEKVMIVQVFTDQPNLERAGRGPRATMTNGAQLTGTGAATIVMAPGEIQLWRIVNATVMNTISANFTGPAGAALPKFRQIAQDGVQFSPDNYKAQPLTTPDGDGYGTKFALAPGGRIDILVQAPALPTGSTSAAFVLGGVVNLTVCGTPVTANFPDDTNYPKFPGFLGNIPRPRKTRTLSFDWEQWRITRGPATLATTPPTHVATKFPLEAKTGDSHIVVDTNRGPYWMIDGKQFEDETYDQTMVLGEDEEWTIYNTTSVGHPFHIHVNPFQVVEVFDPNTPANSFKREEGGVWQDVILIPAAKTTGSGPAQLVIDPETGFPTDANRGYVRIRSRFVDFPGSFVLHCHILAHEDRGMMQLVRVIDGTAPFRHH
jgi:FtsP/CotA-like multicopper oxidase with cupredoxin domain